MHIGKWFHHLFNPHCVDCSLEKVCYSCESLRDQLQHERNTNRELVKALVDLTKPEQVVVQQQDKTPKPVQHRIPWHIQRATLEAEDRALSEEIKKKRKEENKPVSIKDLEEELGVNNG